MHYYCLFSAAIIMHGSITWISWTSIVTWGRVTKKGPKRKKNLATEVPSPLLPNRAWPAPGAGTRTSPGPRLRVSGEFFYGLKNFPHLCNIGVCRAVLVTEQFDLVSCT